MTDSTEMRLGMDCDWAYHRKADEIVMCRTHGRPLSQCIDALAKENELLRNMATEMLHAHALAVSRIGIRPNHPLASSNESYKQAMMDACDRWKKELQSSTSAGTGRGGSRDLGINQHPRVERRGAMGGVDNQAHPIAEVDDAPKCRRGFTDDPAYISDTPDSSGNRERYCPGPTRKEGT